MILCNHLEFLTQQFWLMASAELVEDVVAPLSRQLVSYSGLFQQIYGSIT